MVPPEEQEGRQVDIETCRDERDAPGDIPALIAVHFLLLRSLRYLWDLSSERLCKNCNVDIYFTLPGNILSYETGHARAPALLRKNKNKKAKKDKSG